MAKETYYFSHDFHARSDPKLIRVAMKHKMTGVGVYWCIIEMLYENEGLLLLSDCERIAYELKEDIELINSIVKNFDLFHADATTFWSDSAIERTNIRTEKSNKASDSAKIRWANANAKRTHSEGNAIKDSIVKDIKEKEIKINDIKTVADEPPPIKNSANPKKKILKEKKDVPPPKIHTVCRMFFEDEAERLGKVVSWTGRHGKSLNEILGKIKTGFRKHSGNDPTEQQLEDSFKLFITKLPEWQKQNGYDINSINSGFDRIANEIRSANGKTGTEKSHDDIRAMFRGKK